MSRDTAFPTVVHVRPARTQISQVGPVWKCDYPLARISWLLCIRGQ